MGLPEADVDVYRRLADQLEINNRLLERQTSALHSWKLSLRNGLLAGAGGALGAALLITIVVAVLRPLDNVQGVGPALRRIATALERK